MKQPSESAAIVAILLLAWNPGASSIRTRQFTSSVQSLQTDTDCQQLQRMRVLLIVVLPLLVQVYAYIVVFLSAQGGGSFMGLLAMPVAAASFVALLVHGITSVRRGGAVLSPALLGLAIALLPPIGLLIFRALES
jgi:hypothetical protein